MFITKKAYEQAIQRAVKETEERCWKHHDEYLQRRRKEEEIMTINRRLRVLEEKCGIVTPKDNEVCCDPFIF